MSDPAHLGGFIPFDEHGQMPLLWNYLLTTFQPKTVVDVGCGQGLAAKYFLDHGANAYGIDGSDDAQRTTVLPRERFIRHDFTLGPLPSQAPSFDLIWCCEFVEHVEEQYVDNFMPLLALGKVLALTHARPGEGGYHHVNCQPAEYWIKKLEACGFVLNEYHTRVSHTLDISPFGTYTYWADSGMIFVK